jgi:hypothetical protein
MDLSVVDLAPYLGSAGDAVAEDLRALCATVSGSLRDTGALLVKDPRCSAADNDGFLDVVERYFARSAEDKRLQERPHLHYQVPPTHSFPFRRQSCVLWRFDGLENWDDSQPEFSMLESAPLF